MVIVLKSDDNDVYGHSGKLPPREQPPHHRGLWVPAPASQQYYIVPAPVMHDMVWWHTCWHISICTHLIGFSLLLSLVQVIPVVLLTTLRIFFLNSVLLKTSWYVVLLLLLLLSCIPPTLPGGQLRSSVLIKPKLHLKMIMLEWIKIKNLVTSS